MMTANYHTHTPRCRHASGSEREYVAQALARGLTELGFSDHAPYLYPNGYHSTFRMDPDQLSDYCQTLTALRTEYNGRIALHIGLEMEYYPALFGPTLDWMRQFPLEYLILGQHYLDNEYDTHVYSGAETTSEPVLARYAAQVIEGLSTSCFSYLAHPDLIHYTGPDAIYVRRMRPLVEFAKKHRIPLELNLLGFAEGRHYPHDRFWALVGEVGAPAIIGCDAHRPDAVADPQVVRAAYAYLARFGITPQPRLELRSPFALRPAE